MRNMFEKFSNVLYQWLYKSVGWCFSCLNRADLIKVHDGRSPLAPAITVLCNEGAALEVLSTGPDLFVEFVSNSDWPGQGFKATFQFQPLEALVTSDTPYTGESLQSSFVSNFCVIIDRFRRPVSFLVCEVVNR